MEEYFVFLFICLTCAWILRRCHDRHSILLGTIIPSNKWHLLLGFGTLVTPKDSIQMLSEAVQKYGRNFLMYIGPYPAFVTTDPVSIKDIFISKQCLNKDPIFYGNMEHTMGRGLVTLNEPDWSKERKILNPAFSNKNLMSFMTIFDEEVNDLIKTIDSDIENKPIASLIDYFRKLTVGISIRTMGGRNLRNERYRGKGIENAIENIQEGLEYTSNLVYNYWYFIGIIRALAEKTLYKKSMESLELLRTLISEVGTFMVNIPSPLTIILLYWTPYITTIKELDYFHVKDEFNINTASDYIINDGLKLNKMSKKRGVDHMMHLILSAFETSSTSMFFVITLLAMHPEYQERAYEEICQIFPETDDDDNFEITYDNVNHLVYLDMIIREMMRLLPVVPLVGRTVTDGNLELSNGITLPKGQSVLIDIYGVHHNKEIWGPDADKFNPDNFLPANFEEKHPYAFIPFTKGQRVCIGARYAELSLKITLAKLIRRYKFSTAAKLEDLTLENHISLHLNPIPTITVKRRKKAGMEF